MFAQISKFLNPAKPVIKNSVIVVDYHPTPAVGKLFARCQNPAEKGQFYSWLYQKQVHNPPLFAAQSLALYELENVRFAQMEWRSR